jgi:hypothetical protein
LCYQEGDNVQDLGPQNLSQKWFSRPWAQADISS